MKKNLGNMISWSSVLIVLVAIYTQSAIIVVVGIIIAAIMDLFDGKAARKFGTNTPEAKVFGELTDSLCDIFNYGVAPGLILNYIIFGKEVSLILLLSSGFFLLAGNFRLARFSSLKLKSPIVTYFIGIPITVAGPILAIITVLFTNQIVSILASVILGYLMVSNIKISKLKI